MAWVRRRRAARLEKERLEREAKEKAEKEQREKEEQERPQGEAQAEEAQQVEKEQERPTIAEHPRSSETQVLQVTDGAEHITQAVNVPAPYHHHHHPHALHSRSLSTASHRSTSGGPRSPPERRGSADTAIGVPVGTAPPTPRASTEGPSEQLIMSATPMDGEEDEVPSTPSESESLSYDDDTDGVVHSSSVTEEEDEDEEDDEDLKDETRRKTAVGAGVEKISRHKDKTCFSHFITKLGLGILLPSGTRWRNYQKRMRRGEERRLNRTRRDECLRPSLGPL
ncbi:hypothetical protein K474DRAFT_959300 [Panus rudis PR-1116 ss-1]|nr:hypothetical protein K474DRAFT_959300 [Panus rudis PR-1116 ss-1]